MPAEIHLTSSRRSARGSRFDQTSLTLLGKVRDGDAAALDELCSRYWYPLYTWLLVTRLAANETEAQDYVQGFFLKMLTKGSLATHRPEHGRFRSYLLACLKNQVIDERRARARQPQAVQPMEPEEDPLANIEATETADAAYEKAWAWEVFEAAKDRLLQEWIEAGKGDLFDALAPYLEGNRNEDGLKAIGERHGLSHDNTRARVHRLKKGLYELLVTLVTVDLPEDASAGERSEEMRRYLQALLL